MKNKNFLLIILVFLCISGIFPVFSQPDKILKQRALVGITYRPLTDEDKNTLQMPDLKGVGIKKVITGSSAERADIRAGDIIIGIDNRKIEDISGFLEIIRNYYAGDTAKFHLIRDGKPILIPIKFIAPPGEKSDKIKIEYTSFPSNGILLRAVITSPKNSKNKKLPAVLIVSALKSQRLIYYESYELTKELAYTLSENGFRVIRFELRGYGDSEGDDYRKTDFDTEVSDNIAALDYLTKRSDVEPSKVYVFGHSTGGIDAAIIASKRNISGLIVSCTSGRTYYERLMETVRLQDEFDGKSFAETDKNIINYLYLTTSIAGGEKLEDIIKKKPDVSEFINSEGRIMDDRSVDYWREQLNINLAEVYGKIKEPVLIIYGQSDYITTLVCHEHIRDMLLSSGNRDVTLEVIANLDHRYSYAKDKKESFENYKTDNFTENPAAKEIISSWLKKH